MVCSFILRKWAEALTALTAAVKMPLLVRRCSGQGQ
jgi:hypothetical protein